MRTGALRYYCRNETCCRFVSGPRSKCTCGQVHDRDTPALEEPPKRSHRRRTDPFAGVRWPS